MKRLIPLFAISIIAISLLLLANCKSNEDAAPEAEVTMETVSEAVTTAESEAESEVKASLEVKVETKPEAKAAAQIVCSPVFQPEASNPVDLEPVGHAVRFVGLCMVMTSIIIALFISASLAWALLQKRKSAHDIKP